MHCSRVGEQKNEKKDAAFFASKAKVRISFFKILVEQRVLRIFFLLKNVDF